MIRIKELLGGFAFALALAIAAIAEPVHAQATCDLNGADGGLNANPADGGATATGTGSMACGTGGSTASGIQAVVVGTSSSAQGFDSVVVGSTSVAGPQLGTTVVGSNSSAVGIGATALLVCGRAGPMLIHLLDAGYCGAGLQRTGTPDRCRVRPEAQGYAEIPIAYLLERRAPCRRASP